MGSDFACREVGVDALGGGGDADLVVGQQLEGVLGLHVERRPLPLELRPRGVVPLAADLAEVIEAVEFIGRGRPLLGLVVQNPRDVVENVPRFLDPEEGFRHELHLGGDVSHVDLNVTGSVPVLALLAVQEEVLIVDDGVPEPGELSDHLVSLRDGADGDPSTEEVREGSGRPPLGGVFGKLSQDGRARLRPRRCLSGGSDVRSDLVQEIVEFLDRCTRLRLEGVDIIGALNELLTRGLVDAEVLRRLGNCSRGHRALRSLRLRGRGDPGRAVRLGHRR